MVTESSAAQRHEGHPDFLKPATLDQVPGSPDGYSEGQATAFHQYKPRFTWRITESSRAGKAPANGMS